MLNFLKYLFLFFLAYYLLKYIVRLFAIYKPERKNSHINTENHSQQASSEKTTIFRKKINKDEGDYVDYEEVK